MTGDQPETQISCIKTELKIPKPIVLKWLLGKFPELASDAKLVEANGWGENCTFMVEHTVQPEKPIGPILLKPIEKTDEDPDDDT